MTYKYQYRSQTPLTLGNQLNGRERCRLATLCKKRISRRYIIGTLEWLIEADVTLRRQKQPPQTALVEIHLHNQWRGLGIVG